MLMLMVIMDIATCAGAGGVGVAFTNERRPTFELDGQTR